MTQSFDEIFRGPAIEDLPEDTVFLNVEGIAVALIGKDAYRYDTDPPEYYSLARSRANGSKITRERFMELKDNPY